ncbi:MAG TPA: glycine betaine ABC transporter substrate-binding protein [Acidimicrobiia bacterium]|nr:glycine betaine ABC transporter substrate-binding protein [Acidimicrobiia bacterium]
MHQAPKRHTSRLVAIFAVLAMIIAACGGDDGGVGDGEGDLAGIDITVGSKDFDEQLILGQILVQAFEAEGANVTDRVDLGGTQVARSALTSGEIDVYMEYNGTGWAEHLANEEAPSDDPQELTEAVREQDLERNDIHWLGRAPFNNTYGFVSSPELTEENGGEAYDFQSMADYLEANPDATLCLESEFPDRADGLILFEEATGYDVPDSQIQILDTGPIYTQTNENQCDFGEVFTTDGRIGGLDITLVEDPGVMILYNISMNIRDEKYQEAPEAFDEIADAILNGLTQEKMIELNTRVSFEGETPEDVAADFLAEIGLTS